MPSTQTAAEKAIRLHLAARNKNQAWLATEVGESPFWVGRRMSGAITFNVDALDRIAAVFGTTSEALIADAAKIASEPEAVAS